MLLKIIIANEHTGRGERGTLHVYLIRANEHTGRPSDWQMDHNLIECDPRVKLSYSNVSNRDKIDRKCHAHSVTKVGLKKDIYLMKRKPFFIIFLTFLILLFRTEALHV